MLSSQVKFSADRQTDTSKTICPQSIDAWAQKGLLGKLFICH